MNDDESEHRATLPSHAAPRYERLLIGVAVVGAFSGALLGLLMMPVRSSLGRFLDYLGIGLLLYLTGRTVFRLFIRGTGHDSAPSGATYEWLLDAAARLDEERRVSGGGGEDDVRN